MKKFNEFDTILTECADKFYKRQERYEDLWTDCQLKFLRGKLIEETSEWVQEMEKEHEREELVDMINMCLMLAKRLQDGN